MQPDVDDSAEDEQGADHVVDIQGRKAFKYRIDPKEFLKRLGRCRE